MPASRPKLAIAAAFLVIALAGVGVWLALPMPPHAPVRPRAPARLAYAPPPLRPTRPPPPAFETDLDRIAKAYPGEVGVAVFDVDDGWIAAWQGERAFPQQSVSKIWTAVTLLDEADHGRMDLNRQVTIERKDLSTFNEPIQVLVKPTYTTTIDDLLVRAIRDSDNAANDLLISQIGGVKRIQAVLAAKGVTGVRLGMDEKHLQAVINGLTWKPEYAGTSAISLARTRLPMAYRQQTLANYISHPMDGATPVGTVEGLAALARGKLLSPQSTARLIGIMDKVRTGRERLKGGLERGWTLAHKTGTGPDLAGASVGINDVGLLTAPDGHLYAAAVFIARTRAPTPVRLAFMQRVSELIEAQWSGKPLPAAAPVAEPEPAKVAPHHRRGHRRARHGKLAHHRRRRH